MNRLLRSAKFWAAVIGVGVVVAVEAFGVAQISADQIANAAAAIVSVLIAAIAGEDIAKKLSGYKD